MALNRKQILQYDDTKYKTIKVRAWDNQEVIVKTMTASEKMQFVELVDKNKSEVDTIIHLIIMCCVDENHNKLFEKDDMNILKEKSIDALQQIAEEALKLSEMSVEAVEEAAKN